MQTAIPRVDTVPTRCPKCGGPVPIDSGEDLGDSVCLNCGNLLWFVHKAAGDVAVLTFLPGLLAGSESETRAAEVLAAAGTPPRCVLDLSCLRIMSSLFLAMLIKVHRTAAAAGGRVTICGLDPMGRDILQTTRLDTLFGICDDEASALQSFADDEKQR